MADGVLVRRTLAGEKRAFDELVLRYQRPAIAVAYRLLGKSDDALEIVQEALLKSYRSLGTLQKPEAFAGWLMRIVSNLSLNFRRGRKTRSSLPLNDLLDSAGEHDPQAGGDSVDPERVAEGRELGARLKLALDELPEKQRMAIMLFTMEQLPQKQVAEAMECSVEAVKWHVFQGRKKLKELLKDVV
ncbi:MAG: sigma-70 family RNA polymerase sigma factor [Burkholderiales bacterium]|nr:sigma-70 family RNA polymerase sigma factor [Phycisphaerae bacterium]